MVTYLRKIRDSQTFQYFIIGCIVLAGIQVGLETYRSVVTKWGDVLDVVSTTILVIFIIEAAIKIGAEGNKPWRYFYDPWNVFDFTIIALCLLPFDTNFVTVLRLARILRVLRLVRALPKLQILVGALLKSIPSIAYVSLLLFLLFYLYACSATFLFGANDPVHFGSLQISMVSLFRVVTLEDWTDIMYIQMWGCDSYGYDSMPQLCVEPESNPVLGAVFFISFVLVARFWLVHHALLQHLTQAQVGTMIVNFLVLGLVSLIPFGSALIGTYEFEHWPVAIFSAIMAVTGVSVGLFARHVAVNRHLHRSASRTDPLWHWRYHAVGLPLFAAFAIAFAWVHHPGYALAAWILEPLIALGLTLRRA